MNERSKVCKPGKSWLRLSFFLSPFFLFLFSCQEEVPADVAYTGPVRETNNVTLLYSDSARLAVKVITPKEVVLASGDQVYPQEVRLFFYDKTGQETSTLRSDSGRFYPTRNVFVVKGNVVIKRKKEDDTLLTDEMTWSRDIRKFYTDKPVIWRTRTNELHGVGFTAEQDMSGYVLRKPTGTLPVTNLP